MTSQKNLSCAIRATVGLLSAGALFIGSQEALGESPGIKTFSQCVDYALSHNISLQQSQLQTESSALSLEAAKAQWEPTLDFGTSHTFSNTPWGAGEKNILGGNFNLNAGWTMFDGGVRSNTIKLNEKELEASRLTTESLSRDLRTQLLSIYLNILYARESIDIYRETVALSESQAERGRQLMEAGKLSRVDYAQLLSQYEQDNYGLVSAISQFETRRMELKKILQLQLTDSLDIETPSNLESHLNSPLPSAEETLRLAIGNDVELQALSLNRDAAELQEKVAAAGKSPRISLSAGIGTSYMVPTSENFGKDLRNSWGENVGISMTLPLADQKKTKVAVANARIAILNNELDRDSRLLDLSQAVENWYVDTREARSRYQAAKKQEEAASLSAQLIDERFRLGLVNPVELQTAHNTLLEARHSLLQAKYMALLGYKMIEYYRTTNIEL